jgi:hypothetical protein
MPHYTLAYHEGIRARRQRRPGSPPEPWRWFPLSVGWIRGWSVADAEELEERRIARVIMCEKHN